MKKTVLLLTALLMGCSLMQAKPIDRDVALAAAKKFATAQMALERTEPQLVYTAQNDAFFVFNLGSDSFVIIAGDDAYRPVIGFSDASRFDADNIPPALQDYLDGIAERIGRMRRQGNATATPLVAAEWASVTERGLLLSRNGGRERTFFCQTKWNQDYPYNICCPEDPAGSGGHTYVGCLATAMSQLMRFWAYPTKGNGSHCYNHSDYGQICADFGSTNYDWDNMPNVLNNNSTDEEKLATGTLCFHCGVTIDMGYGPDGSGGASGPIPGVMNTYFNYSEANVQLRRDDYETETWKTMVREQFDMGWPMYYGGCENDGCHAFVCDGYDDNDYFHFNLGWGGSSDGWYHIDEAPYTHPADAMFNFVPALVYNATPSSPDDFTATPVSDTDLKVRLSWTNPTTTLDGTPLTEIEQMVVLRNNRIIQTLTGMAPGQTVETEDDDVPCYDAYHYAVYAVAGDRVGKHANVTDVIVGPTCNWQLLLTTTSFQGWRGGYISVYNNSGHELGQYTMNTSAGVMVDLALPLGKVSFGWTAPSDPVSQLGFVIKDRDGNTVYSFSGASEELAEGIFFETNNSCGGSLDCGVPEELVATATDEGVLLEWDAVANEGYGYNIYRDGLLYRLIPAGTATTYWDADASLGGHCYRVSVLCDGGESGEFTNESCASVGPCYPPRNLDFVLANNFKPQLQWEAPQPNDGLSGYYLFRKTGEDGEYQRIKLLGPTATSYKDNSVSVEGDYYYRLYAYYGEWDCTSSPANRHYYSNAFELHVYYSPTGVEENETRVKVYPNPANDRLAVEAEGISYVELYNTLGQRVVSQEAEGDHVEVDLQQAATGLYLLRVTTSEGIAVKRVTVER